jgi:polysaccharide pyruvyl transferase WcaK-like protein
MKNYIALLDPSLMDNNGTLSFNLGDVIIYEAISKFLKQAFADKEIIRISTHAEFDRREINLIKGADFAFVGGTNLLTSDIRHFPRFTPRKRKFFYLFPKFKNAILFGAGWNRYEKRPDLFSSIYYNNVLNKKYFHSVRDGYSQEQLKKAFIRNTLNTSCPTTWELNPDFENRFNPVADTILFTITDYAPNPESDAQLINLLLKSESKHLFFFPQGRNDIHYLQSIDSYKKNKSRIFLLDHNYDAFINFVDHTHFNYVGTRLHAGIRCLSAGNPALIISIDNRTTEIGKDIRLHVAPRNDFRRISKWIHEEYKPAPLKLPVENIQKWKMQFAK